MLSDGYPFGYEARTSVLNTPNAIAETRTAAGDAEVHVLDLGIQSAPYGADWHQSAATQAAMASALVELVDSLDLM